LSAVTTKNMAVLHEAVEAGNLEMVQLILSFPDSIKVIDSEDYPQRKSVFPIKISFSLMSASLFSFSGRTPLRLAIRSLVAAIHAKEAAIRALMKEKKEKEKETEKEREDSRQDYEVHLEGDIERHYRIIELLLEKGAAAGDVHHSELPPLGELFLWVTPTPDEDDYAIPNAGEIQVISLSLSLSLSHSHPHT